MAKRLKGSAPARPRNAPPPREADTELVCYVRKGWTPRIEAASGKRGWMTETPESFAYRCLRPPSPTPTAGSC